MVQIISDKICSKCGSVNMHELTQSDTQDIVTCKVCGHKKEIERPVMTVSSGGKTIYYKYKEPNNTY